MKTFKPIIIAAIALVLVVGIAGGLYFLIPAIAPDNGEVGEITTPQSVSSAMNKIVDRSSKDVASVEITTDTGESFTIEYGEDELGAQTAVMKGGDSRLKYNESDMTTLSGFVGLLVALDEIGEGNDADFGFDKPQRTIKINFKGGEPVTLLLGKDTPIGTDGVYIKRTDRNTIYTIGGSTTQILMMTMSDYRDFRLFNPLSSSDELLSVTISRKGEKPITVVRKPDTDKAPQSQAEAALAVDYALTSPVERDANPDTIYTSLLDKVAAIEFTGIAEDYPKDLSKYGLDNPVSLKFTTELGGEQSILIGDKTPSGGRYVMPEGAPTVLETAADIDLEMLNYTDIVMQLIWFHNSEDIDTVTYELPGGESHTMKLEVKDNSLIGTYDGKVLQNKNATNLFLRTVRFTISGEYTSDMKYGDREIKATMKLKNGNTTSLELYRINERHYAAAIDGKAPQYYVDVTQAKELIESFSILASGADIPNMF